MDLSKNKMAEPESTIRRPTGIYARLVLSTILASVTAGGETAAGANSAVDEPGLDLRVDEPGLSYRLPSSPSLAQVRLELAFGYASLLEDPDIEEGYGGGIFVAWGIHQRLGVEASVFVSNTPFGRELGEIGSTFAVGNINLGPMVQLTRPGQRFSVTAELTMGAYMVVPLVQETVWSLGFGGGLTFSLKLTRWLGVGLKWRYHLFNIARLSGPELRDLKAFRKVGVVDRMELPGYVAFYF